MGRYTIHRGHERNVQKLTLLPPCRLGLSVFLWRASVGHKAGNGVLAVALGEGVQQRAPGLLILL